MGDDAWSVYQERLRLNKERKASRIRRAEALAVVEDEEALQDFLAAREDDLKARMDALRPARDSRIVYQNFDQRQYNQFGDGGQNVAGTMYGTSSVS